MAMHIEVYFLTKSHIKIRKIHCLERNLLLSISDLLYVWTLLGHYQNASSTHKKNRIKYGTLVVLLRKQNLYRS